MNQPDHHNRIQNIFESALLLPAEDRAAYLSEQCGSNEKLHAEVESKLQYHIENMVYPDDNGADKQTEKTVSYDYKNISKSVSLVGTKIGPYKIIEPIGEGGMGTVYLAEQVELVKRRVALKIIKLGMDTKQVIARFEAERQALAMMDHPNVAQVYDGGISEDGRSYFVMEYVPGIPITKYCDKERLNTRERLELFVNVCNAVQHAHQKGIIHRDLKPGNVLVMIQDGKAVPKVIDFGVAKATNQALTERTIYTELGQLIGTLEYMSPEQVEMTGLNIDTRSDVYSLGVLLYELLTGALPFESSELRQVAIGEIQRIIREDDPQKPSTKLSNIGSASLTLAKFRRTDARSLGRQIKGDLDWIVMKAIEKNRARRYETANGLAADIRRHLRNEPVVAGPPGPRYRIGKFVKRNRVGVIAAGLVCLALIIGIVGTSWGILTAVAARDAERLAKEDTQTALDLAEEREAEAVLQADNAREINNFLTADLLAAVAPSAEAGAGRDVLMRDVLDVASQKIEDAAQYQGRFADKPLIEASIRATLGETYRLLGEYANAQPHLERARLLKQRVYGDTHQDTLLCMSNLAILYMDQGRYEEAEKLFNDTLRISKHLTGINNPQTLSIMNNLALLYWKQGRYDEAEMLYLQTLENRKQILGDKHPDTLITMNNLALLYTKQGRYEKAEPLYLQTLEIEKRELGQEHPETLSSINNLANLYSDQGRYDEAESLYLQTLNIRKRILGNVHPDTLSSMNNLANLYSDLGRYNEAESLYLQSLEIKKQVLGTEHPDTLSSMNNLANLYNDQGRYDEAEPLYLQTLDISQRVLGEEHPDTLSTMNNLANLFCDQSRYDEAEPLYLHTLEIRMRVLGDEHPDTLSSMNNLANLYTDQGRTPEAEKLYLNTIEISKRILGEEHPDTLSSMYNLANLYINQGRYEEAEPLYLQVLENRKQVLGREHPGTLNTMNNLANLYKNQGNYTKAEKLHLETLEIRQRVLGEEHPDTLYSLYNLAELLILQKRFPEAEPIAIRCYTGNLAVYGAKHPETLDAIELLDYIYEARDEAEPGEGYNEKAAEWRARLPVEDVGELDNGNVQQSDNAEGGGG